MSDGQVDPTQQPADQAGEMEQPVVAPDNTGSEEEVKADDQQ